MNRIANLRGNIATLIANHDKIRLAPGECFIQTAAGCVDLGAAVKSKLLKKMQITEDTFAAKYQTFKIVDQNGVQITNVNKGDMFGGTGNYTIFEGSTEGGNGQFVVELIRLGGAGKLQFAGVKYASSTEWSKAKTEAIENPFSIYLWAELRNGNANENEASVISNEGEAGALFDNTEGWKDGEPSSGDYFFADNYGNIYFIRTASAIGSRVVVQGVNDLTKVIGVQLDKDPAKMTLKDVIEHVLPEYASYKGGVSTETCSLISDDLYKGKLVYIAEDGYICKYTHTGSAKMLHKFVSIDAATEINELENCSFENVYQGDFAFFNGEKWERIPIGSLVRSSSSVVDFERADEYARTLYAERDAALKREANNLKSVIKDLYGTKADLDPVTHKIISSQLPDSLLGATKYAGVITLQDLGYTNGKEGDDPLANTTLNAIKENLFKKVDPNFDYDKNSKYRGNGNEDEDGKTIFDESKLEKGMYFVFSGDPIEDITPLLKGEKLVEKTDPIDYGEAQLYAAQGGIYGKNLAYADTIKKVEDDDGNVVSFGNTSPSAIAEPGIKAITLQDFESFANDYLSHVNEGIEDESKKHKVSLPEGAYMYTSAWAVIRNEAGYIATSAAKAKLKNKIQGLYSTNEDLFVKKTKGTELSKMPPKTIVASQFVGWDIDVDFKSNESVAKLFDTLNKQRESFKLKIDASDGPIYAKLGDDGFEPFDINGPSGAWDPHQSFNVKYATINIDEYDGDPLKGALELVAKNYETALEDRADGLGDWTQDQLDVLKAWLDQFGTYVMVENTGPNGEPANGTHAVFTITDRHGIPSIILKNNGNDANSFTLVYLVPKIERNVLLDIETCRFYRPVENIDEAVEALSSIASDAISYLINKYPNLGNGGAFLVPAADIANFIKKDGGEGSAIFEEDSHYDIATALMTNEIHSRVVRFLIDNCGGTYDNTSKLSENANFWNEAIVRSNYAPKWNGSTLSTISELITDAVVSVMRYFDREDWHDYGSPNYYILEEDLNGALDVSSELVEALGLINANSYINDADGNKSIGAGDWLIYNGEAFDLVDHTEEFNQLKISSFAENGSGNVVYDPTIKGHKRAVYASNWDDEREELVETDFVFDNNSSFHSEAPNVILGNLFGSNDRHHLVMYNGDGTIVPINVELTADDSFKLTGSEKYTTRFEVGSGALSLEASKDGGVLNPHEFSKILDYFDTHELLKGASDEVAHFVDLESKFGTDYLSADGDMKDAYNDGLADHLLKLPSNVSGTLATSEYVDSELSRLEALVVALVSSNAGLGTNNFLQTVDENGKIHNSKIEQIPSNAASPDGRIDGFKIHRDMDSTDPSNADESKFNHNIKMKDDLSDVEGYGSELKVELEQVEIKAEVDHYLPNHSGVLLNNNSIIDCGEWLDD